MTIRIIPIAILLSSVGINSTYSQKIEAYKNKDSKLWGFMNDEYED